MVWGSSTIINNAAYGWATGGCACRSQLALRLLPLHG
jgi:hypothetical protein